MRKAVRDAFVGLTTLGLFMLVVLHPDIPTKVIGVAAHAFTGVLGLARPPKVGS